MDFIKLHRHSDGQLSLFNTMIIKEIYHWSDEKTKIVFDDNTITYVTESIETIEKILNINSYFIPPLYPGKITKYYEDDPTCNQEQPYD